MPKKIPCEVYSRVVGYLRPVQNWNKGKRQEFKERVTYKAENEIHEQRPMRPHQHCRDRPCSPVRFFEFVGEDGWRSQRGYDGASE